MEVSNGVKAARKTILVVDDEQELVEMLKMRLEASGYVVHAAFDGLEALSAVKNNKPDLIILDIMLPKLDGISVLLKLKSDPQVKDIPVIMLSAIQEDEEVRIAKNLNAVDYIKKPFTKEDLIAKIENALK